MKLASLTLGTLRSQDFCTYYPYKLSLYRRVKGGRRGGNLAKTIFLNDLWFSIF